MSRQHPLSGSAVGICVGLGLAWALLAPRASAHDEDWRKLADRMDPIQGPIWRAGQSASRSMFDAQGISLLSWIPLNNFEGSPQSGADCWGYVSPSGREYALMTHYVGFSVVEITDPVNPKIIASFDQLETLWHDVKVVGHHAYAVSEGGLGVRVFDLSEVDEGRVDYVGSVTTGGHTTTHNIVVNPDGNDGSGSLWLVGANVGNGGLVYLDLSDPRNPTPTSGWTGMYVHDAQVVTMPDGPFAGREIAFCASGLTGGFTDTGLRIVDVTDPSNATVLSTLLYPGAGYSHQVWATPDMQYLYLNDELDESNGLVATTTTRIIDISDLTNPSVVDSFTTELPAIDHNLYVRDGLIFEANYRSGLRIFDGADPVNPVEVGYFDTFPEDDGLGFNGAWSVYPYFPSRTLIVSDMERGLFVLRADAVDPERLDLTLGAEIPATVGSAGGHQVSVIVDEVNLTLRADGVAAVFDDGTGPRTIQATPGAGPNEWVATLPRAACGAKARVHFTATATSGETFSLPWAGATAAFTTLVVDTLDPAFADSFETDQGWTVSGDAIAGAWERGVPANGGRGDPPSDADGSGRAYLTENFAGNSDVDEGRTTLTSPTINVPGDGRLLYSYWVGDIPTGPLSSGDGLFVELSIDGGAWQLARSHTYALQRWRSDVIDVAGASSVQVRFTAVDEGTRNVLEAGVDNVRFEVFLCDAGCPADFNGDDVLDFFDVSAFLAAFNAQDPAADFNGDESIDFFDVSAFLSAFNAGCP